MQKQLRWYLEKEKLLLPQESWTNQAKPLKMILEGHTSRVLLPTLHFVLEFSRDKEVEGNSYLYLLALV